jgi:hypothetical protein
LWIFLNWQAKSVFHPDSLYEAEISGTHIAIEIRQNWSKTILRETVAIQDIPMISSE